ncbi:MAG: insulinase family protein [Betaproteobacteria bacterium]|nr:insulinase family protein [Betaproteobacteria bacterium]
MNLETRTTLFSRAAILSQRFARTGRQGLLVTLAWVACAQADADLFDRTLPNGMKVIVREDRRAPVVVSMVWYRAGSMDEVNGKTGVAHVLEHMMFKGTESVPPGEFSRRIARAGGRDNAFTSRDHTAYHQQLANTQLELALRLEADRMANLVLTEEEFSKEIQVVMEERRKRTEDQATSRLYEQLMATAYVAHPYRAPIIGWMNDLENLTVEDTREWYEHWYVPNNAVLIVVGDVRAAEVFDLAQTYFGPISARPLPPRKPQGEPAQQGTRRFSLKAPAELPRLVMAYHVPTLRDIYEEWEPYALSVLAAVLDGHDAARLDRSLVRERNLAVNAGAYYDGANRGPALFVLDGTPAPGTTLAVLESAFKAEIQRILDEGVGAKEMQRVKAQVIAGQVFAMDSVFNQGRLMGSFEMAGLPYYSARAQSEKLTAVTSEQVQAVARMYLVDDKLTVAQLDPLPVTERKPAGPSLETRH